MHFIAKPYIRESGFTLTELLITLSISAILVALTIPSYRTLMARNLQASEINSYVHHFHLARSLAITKETQHVLCPSLDGSHCAASTDWGQGFILYEDTDSNEIQDPNEPLQGVHQSDHEIDIHASQDRRLVAYQRDGRPSGYNLTLTFCDPDEQIPPKAIIVNNVGRVRVSQTRWDGTPLDCGG